MVFFFPNQHHLQVALFFQKWARQQRERRLLEQQLFLMDGVVTSTTGIPKQIQAWTGLLKSIICNAAFNPSSVIFLRETVQSILENVTEDTKEVRRLVVLDLSLPDSGKPCFASFDSSWHPCLVWYGMVLCIWL